jgi:hypothetical protein
LSSRGYGKDDVNLLMSDDTRKKYFTETDTELGTKAWEDAGKGATSNTAVLTNDNGNANTDGIKSINSNNRNANKNRNQH